MLLLVAIPDYMTVFKPGCPSDYSKIIITAYIHTDMHGDVASIVHGWGSFPCLCTLCW